MRPAAFILGLFALAAAACAPTQDPVSYLLDAQARPTGALSGPPLGLREITLPLYARRAQIAVLGTGGEVTLSDNHKWAEEPPRAASRQVARILAAELQRPVVIEPWPRGVTPTRRVDIDVDYFIGSLGGDLRLGGQYRLVEAANPSAAAITTFEYTETLGAPTYAAFVAGHSRALSRLAEDIAREIAASGS